MYTSIGNAVRRELEPGVTQVVPLDDPVYVAWLQEGNRPSLPPEPERKLLIERARAEALPIRQLALDVLTGLQTDALVDGNNDVAVLCRSARQRVKDMGALQLETCPGYDAMRQAYKAEWASIAATFSGHPLTKAAFEKALR